MRTKIYLLTYLLTAAAAVGAFSFCLTGLFFRKWLQVSSPRWSNLGTGSGVERIDPVRFLAGCRKRRLNRALCVLSLSLGFLSVSVVLLTRATFFVVLFCALFVCSICCKVVFVRLSVPPQVTDRKDSTPKWPASLTHSLTHRYICCR